MIRALHGLLRCLLPGEFRRLHGAAMGDLFAEAHERAMARGVRAVLGLWYREALDLAATGRRLRVERRARAEGAGGLRSHVRSARSARPYAGNGVRGSASTRVGFLTGLRDDARQALRALARRPSTTAFAALTVALGIGSTTAIFSTLEGVVLHPLPYEGADRMVQLWQRPGNAPLRTSPTREQAEALAAQADLVEASVPWMVDYATLTGPDAARTLDLGLIRPSFHDVVGRPPLLGRAFSEDELVGEGARVLLLGHGLWEEAFGADRGVLGRTLTLDGQPWTVVGVMPERTVLAGWGVVQVDVWAPLSDERLEAGTSVTALLQPGSDVGTVNERLARAAPGADGTWGDSWRAEVSSMRELIGTALVDTLTVLMVAVALLLLIACVNVSNLLLSNASARRRETAVRSALGAGRARLMRQFLAESVFIALLGGALGVALAHGGQQLMTSLRPESLSALDTVRLNSSVLLFAFALTGATGVGFGLFPAYQASRPDALEPLSAGTRHAGDRAGARFRWGLVSVQVGLSFSLLVAALLVLTALGRLNRSDVEFQADRVVVLDVDVPQWRFGSDEERAVLYDELAERLRDLPGVEQVAQAGGVPGRAGITFGTVAIEGGEPSEESYVVHGPSIDDQYFAALGQSLVAGRAFTAEEVRSGADVVVVGEGMARRFFGSDALGQDVRMGSDTWYTVVGVASDVPMTGLGSSAAQLQGYFPLRRGGGGTTVIRLRADADADAVLPLVRAAALETDEAVLLSHLSLASDLLRGTLDRERFALSLIAAFAMIALALAAVGLYGLLAHIVGQRVREIGLRMALGASRGSVQRMVLRAAGTTTLVGIFLGTALAAAGIALLRSRLFGVEGGRPVTYLIAATLLGGTALLAAYVPARRASRVDPVSAMRTE